MAVMPYVGSRSEVQRKPNGEDWVPVVEGVTVKAVRKNPFKTIAGPAKVLTGPIPMGLFLTGLAP
jgi:hypothetical protein